MAKEPKPFEVPSDDMQSMLFRARQVDPRCEEAAVRGYAREIVEAEVMLDTIDLSTVPLSVSFYASWEDASRS